MSYTFLGLLAKIKCSLIPMRGKGLISTHDFLLNLIGTRSQWARTGFWPTVSAVRRSRQRLGEHIALHCDEQSLQCRAGVSAARGTPHGLRLCEGWCRVRARVWCAHCASSYLASQAPNHAAVTRGAAAGDRTLQIRTALCRTEVVVRGRRDWKTIRVPSSPGKHREHQRQIRRRAQ